MLLKLLGRLLLYWKLFVLSCLPRNLVIVYHVIITVIDQSQFSCNINTNLLTQEVGEIEQRYSVYLRVIVGTLILLLFLKSLLCLGVIVSQSTNKVFNSVSNSITFNNPTMMILGACVIQSLSRSDNGTRMSCPDEFCWSTGSNTDCQVVWDAEIE